MFSFNTAESRQWFQQQLPIARFKAQISGEGRNWPLWQPLHSFCHKHQIYVSGIKPKHFFGLRKKKSLSIASGGTAATTSAASRSSTLTSMTSQIVDTYSTHRSESGIVDPDLVSIGTSCATLSGKKRFIWISHSSNALQSYKQSMIEN